MTLFLSIVAFLGGVYVGARYGEKLRSLWRALFG